MQQIIPTLLCLVTLSTLIGCEPKPKTTGEKIENKVNDALDRRPGEKIRDVAEDTKDAIKK